jgi:hypothetical protein
MMKQRRSGWPRWARVLTGVWVLVPLLVIALVAGGFFGYGAYTRSKPTTYSKGGAFGVVASATPSATASASQSPTVVPTASGRGNTAGHPTPTPTPSATASVTATTSTAATQPTRTAAPGRTNQVVVPKVGQYTLAVTGSEKVTFGPISACHNTFPSHATLDIHQADGESPTSYDFDVRLYPGAPNRHDERHIYNYSAHSVDLTYEEATVTCSGIKQSTTLDYAPPQTRVELPLHVGASWHNQGGGADRTETGTSNVVAKTRLAVDGRSYLVYEIVTNLVMSGKESGTRHQVWWYSPKRAMYLKLTESETGKRSGAKYSDYYTATVVGMP